MPSGRFEPAIPAFKPSQTFALDRTVNGVDRPLKDFIMMQTYNVMLNVRGSKHIM